MPPKPAASTATGAGAAAPKTPAAAHATKDEHHAEDPAANAPEDDGVVKQGTFSFPDGATYTGEYRSMGGKLMRHGRGRMVHGPEQYDGDWDNDAMQGRGVYRFASGASYEVRGAWRELRRRGRSSNVMMAMRR
ncbi:hypothetical protein PINS_up007933 [Pythium insidiosum]|nr:hypothetical protein PINS_up007933 [Pythium insidiosum]